LDDAQHFRLQAERQLAYLIEEKSTRGCLLERANPPFPSIREGAANVTEQLGFEQWFR
jgi:hypothetical protein